MLNKFNEVQSVKPKFAVFLHTINPLCAMDVIWREKDAQLPALTLSLLTSELRIENRHGKVVFIWKSVKFSFGGPSFKIGPSECVIALFEVCDIKEIFLVKMCISEN